MIGRYDKVRKTSKPAVAGIINIITGCIKLLGAVYLILFVINVFEFAELSNFFNGFLLPIWISITLLIIFGVLAITGGIYNVQRKRWGWALTSSIIVIFPCIILGITTTILTMLSKNEFQ